MKALVTTNNVARLALTKILSSVTPRAFVGPMSPMQLQDIPDPALPAADWAIARTRLCGSDYKQVFMNGAIDNPMTGFISWPQVLGHEVVGSNGFGVEEYDGRRQHAMEWYFEFIRTQRIDYTSIISHRFSLDAYREAFMVCYAQGDHAAVKVLFDRFGGTE